MSEFFCPVCGKPNPGLGENCQYCGALLMKNATEPLPPILPGDVPEKKKTSDLERTLPGWLRDARKASQKDGVLPEANNSVLPSGPPNQKPETSLPAMDFLAGLNQLGDTEEETSGWLKSLQSSLPAHAAAEPAPISEPEPEPEPNPKAKFTPAEAEASEPVFQTEDPSIYADLPDWLAALTGGPAQAASRPSENQPVPTADDSDWLSSLGGDFISEETAPAADQSPISVDWLAGLSETGQFNSVSSAFPVAPETPAPVPMGDMPDWLANLQGTSAAPASESAFPVAPETPAPVPMGDMPDWLANLQGTSAAPASESAALPSAVESTSASQSGDISDWLLSVQSAGPASVPTTEGVESQVEPAFDDLPDWLSSVSGYHSAQAVPADEPNVPELPATPPFAYTPVESSAAAGTDPVGVVDQQGQPFEPGTFADVDKSGLDSEQLDWLENLGTPPSVSNTPVQSTAPDSPGITTEAEVKSSSVENPKRSDSTEEQKINSILSMDTPDWLSGLAPNDGAGFVESKTPASADSDLSVSELPSWVQAMRPMESVMMGANDEGEEAEIEHQGPFAGLRSILPPQSVLTEQYKTKAYATRLMTTETQLSQSALLENLINSEDTPRPVSKPAGFALAGPIRWVIAGVLLLVLLIVSALGTTLFPVPVAPVDASPVGLFIKTITALPDGAPVLVVMDYQPGFAGELETVAGPVFEHLMSKKTRLIFVSTSPFGEVLADRLMQKFSKIYTYQTGVQYINLGYLPGGAASIKAFAERPGSTLGSDVILGNLWNLPVLRDVNVNSEPRLSNFAVVIVVTDNPDTGRLWIEQARLSLGSKPMLMVVSTQAGPMLQPYMLSNQLNGLVSGLEGGMLYENVRGKFGQARTYWDSFGSGLLVTELFIFIGGAWSLFAGWRARRASMEQDEA